ncbi:MAG: four helix bundle protein [Candidatus Omnitrophota bacterium]|nr:four helix bundle protein [Candidatus Omnitrophota bacterium]
MQIKRFEEIEAWKEARAMTKMIYTLTGDVFFEKDFGLASQIQRATVSVMSNIAEGFDSGSKPEFIRFLGYSRRSASEVQSHLYAALDQRYIKETQFEEVYRQAEKVRKLISAFLRYLRSSGSRQPANRLTGELANRG